MGTVGVLGAAASLYSFRRDSLPCISPRRPVLTVPLVVGTDCEPDDMVALLQLKYDMKDSQPLAVVVGEGDVTTKTRRMQVYCRLLGWHDTVVVSGLPSAKAFAGDGCDLPLVKDMAGVEAIGLAPGESWSSLFRSLFRDRPSAPCELFPSPTLLYLKPPRELVEAEVQDPAQARELFNTVTLALYGSFNLREVGYGSVTHWLNPGTTPFHRVKWFENFGGLSEGTKSLTAQNMDCIHGRKNYPAHQPLPAPGTPLSLYCECLREVARRWDEFILQDCEDTCRGIEKIPGWQDDPLLVEQHRRNKTCFDIVSPSAGKQVAAADPVLVVALLHRHTPLTSVRAVTIPEGSSYPKLEFEDMYRPDPKVGMYRNLDDDEVKFDIAHAFRAAFGIGPSTTTNSDTATETLETGVTGTGTGTGTGTRTGTGTTSLPTLPPSPVACPGSPGSLESPAVHIALADG